MAEEVTLQLPANVKEKLSGMAAQSGLSLEKLASVLLEGFVEGEGTVYSGTWPEGPGIRLLPDWPRFSSKVFQIPDKERK